MPLNLIKNNFKLSFRRKWLLIMLFIGPLLIIELVSSAFSKFMASYEDCGPVDVGFRIESNGAWNQVLESEDILNNQEFKFTQYDSDDIESLISNEYCDVFVVFNGMDYTVYESDDHATEALSTEYLLNEISQQMAFGSVSQGTMIAAEKEEFEGAPDIDSRDYYGFVYIIFFAGCAIITISPVYSSENKNGITKRYGITGTNCFGLFMGKFIPCIIIQAGLTVLTAISATAIFDIHWENIPAAAAILALTIIAFSLFEMFLCYIIPNASVSTGMALVILWSMGFIGGSFETYIYSSTAQWLKDIDPLYYINRSIVELGSTGSSTYTGKCVVMLSVLSVVFLIAGLLISSRKEGKLK